MQVTTIDKDKIFDNEWLGIGDTSKFIPRRNIIYPTSEEDINKPGLVELRTMRKPEYFGWAVERLFGVRLIPEQMVILHELWNRTFPIFIASRGFGKCLVGNTVVQTNKRLLSS